MRHHLLVDSRDRDFEAHPGAGSYRVRLPRQYRHVTAARLLSADIPSSFFVFSAAHGNTSLVVRVGTLRPATVTLPDGNYDTETLPSQLALALRQAFPTKTLDVSIDPLTMQLVIECGEGDAVEVDTRGDADAKPTDWGLAYYLGFPRGVLASGAPLRGPGVVNLNPFTYILLDIAELGTVDEGGMYGGAVGKGCFAKIPISGISYEYIFRDVDKAVDAVECKPAVPRLETLTVTFRLHSGAAIDFRGVEHSFLLEVVTKDPAPPRGLALGPAVRAPRRRRRRRGLPSGVGVAVDAPPTAVVRPPSPRYATWAAVVVLLAGGWWWYRRRE